MVQQYLDRITITYTNTESGLYGSEEDNLKINIDVYDNSLSKKWLAAINNILKHNLHLEKNYCFHGWLYNDRDGSMICDEINKNIKIINDYNNTTAWFCKGLTPYTIDDHFDLATVINTVDEIGYALPGLKLDQNRTNMLHRYFEDLQGTANNISPYYTASNPDVKYAIRQLNLLCHELESWATSNRKSRYSPEWVRPSQLMNFLNAPYFKLEEEDLVHFGIDALDRDQGGVYMGINKAVGKSHYETFRDEDGNMEELVTIAMNAQDYGTGSFDVEWGKTINSKLDFVREDKEAFIAWLRANNLDPEDPLLTIGHPKVGQIDLKDTFGAGYFGDDDSKYVMDNMERHTNVVGIKTSEQSSEFDYDWFDDDYADVQKAILYK